MRQTEPRSTPLRMSQGASIPILARWVVVTALLIGIAGAAGATPPSATDLSTVTGCCVCRGPVGGQPNATKSCTDALQVNDCMTKCQGESATSVVFGRDHTCASGCVGLAPQTSH